MSVTFNLFPTLPDPATREQVCDALGISMRTLDRWIDGGHLPAYRVGPRRLVIRKQDVLALAHRVDGAA